LAFGNLQVGLAFEAQQLENLEIPQITVQQYMNASPGVSAWTPPGGNTIYINAYWFTDNSLNWSQALIMHEQLHNLFGLDDGDIEKALGLGGPSVSITHR
jgi:hypothetical protein